MWQRRLSVAACAVLALATMTLFVLDVPPSATAAGDCPPYELIGARGSGQGELGSESNMGPEVHDFYVTLQGLIGKALVKGYGVHYPAVNVISTSGVGAALHAGFLGKYTDSVREGTKDAEARIWARHARCPDTRFILSGYSQGAQAVGDALERKPAIQKLVAAAAFFGDPYFNADSWSSRGSFDPASYGAFGPRNEWDDSLHGRVFSYCHYHDAICNETVRHHILGTDSDVYVRSLDDPKGRFAAHITPAYRLIPNHGQGDAGFAARDVARALGFTPAPIPYSGPLDIAFVIDSTGSMADEIDQVKENVTALVAQIASIDPDYRLALVDYKDSPDEESDYQSRLDVDFTTDIPRFDGEVEALEAEGGGDTPESVFSGLMTALNLDWRAGSKKIVVQIGDAPAKDPEPVTGLTLRAVQAKALAVDPATIDAIQTGEEEDAKDSFGAIATATGGQYLQLPEPDSSGLAPAIADEIRRNTIAPAAVLDAPSRAVAGSPVSFSAGASHDVGEAIGGYDWDFNGDGVFDASTLDPVASYTYTTPFTGTAAVRIRSVSGLASIATAPIVVTAPTSNRPAPPAHLHRKLGRSKLTLSWTAGRGSAPQWFSVLDRHRHPLVRVEVQGNPRRDATGKRRIFTATIGGLEHGPIYRFFVAAGNDAGESRPAGPVSVKFDPRRPHRRR
jgi:Cutinase/von Willebrand factor type A domain/PKD domain